MKKYIIIRKYILSSFSYILFAANQSGTNCNVIRQKSTALSHISQAFYLSRQHFSIKGSSQTTLSHIF